MDFGASLFRVSGSAFLPRIKRSGLERRQRAVCQADPCWLVWAQGKLVLLPSILNRAEAVGQSHLSNPFQGRQKATTEPTLKAQSQARKEKFHKDLGRKPDLPARPPE